MTEFKGNSYASKEASEKTKEKITPVVQADAVRVKKGNDVKKFASRFIAEDAKSVGSHIFDNVVAPTIQRLIVDTVKNAIDFIIYGRKGSSSNRNNSIANTVSYSNYYDRNKQPLKTVPDMAYQQKVNIRTANDFIFDDRGAAEDVLNRMCELVDRYGMASIGDFFDLIAQKSSYTEQKYGWRNLQTASVVRYGDGYCIDFPKATVLE